MANALHLEKMGSELKCPICLSLLNSSVSLTCNHVFCNSCIEKSMKSGSDCPVCKVPFRRREIRPAPHMDNLVSIYKSMEIASGVNIFVTQSAPAVRSAGYDNQPEGDQVCGIQENSKTSTQNMQEHQKRRKKKGQPKLSNANSRKSCLDAVKPSFPTKKRVHVPQYPPSETPTLCAKLMNDNDEVATSEPGRDLNMQKDSRILIEKGEPSFTPFFWLRDEDNAEKITQQTDGDLFTTPPEVPCFSDIKDSDDEVPCKTSPNREACVATSDADFFDSEMFEWTQRACSPELHTSPVKMQVVQVKDTSGDAPDKNEHVSPDATTVWKSGIENSRIMIHEEETDEAGLVFSSSPRDKILKKGRGKPGKRVRNTFRKVQNKRAKRTSDEAFEVPKKLEEVTGLDQQEEKVGDNGIESNMMKKSYKNKVEFGATVTGKASANFSNSSSGINALMPDSNNIVVEPSALSDIKIHRKRSNFKKNEKTSKNVSLEKKSGYKSEARKLKASSDGMTKNQSELLVSRSPKKSSPLVKQVLDKEIKIRKCEVSSAKKKKYLKRVKFSKDNLGQNSNSLGIDRKVSKKDTQKLEVLEANPNSRNLNNSSRVEDIPNLSESFLNKCETLPNEILCAFCRSPEESEAAGSMVHYLEGKPVPGDQIGGPNIIHSHKSCTEWAPNVFFQDDKAVNLETELTRSKRIKCCFCGIRGAALGCYEKSCRRSFHVPCAKMIPECRWDYDNFVMLCPFHALCKLPCEIHGSQSNQKSKSVRKRPSHIHQPELQKDDDKAQLQSKSFKNPKNFVLCCSGLTDVEKGNIDEFERLSGVKVLKNWDQSVTHVIASTDEKGACKRTLKFLMGVLEGKWILTIEWVKASMNSMEFVDEQKFEIKVDVHGIRDGPSLGRLRLSNKNPKLFKGYKFYFMSDFVSSYKRYLHDLVVAAGGTVLNRKPISGEQEKFLSGCSTLTTFIIYSLELPENCKPIKINSIFSHRRSEAEALASSTRAVAASNSWILCSISGCKLQKLT